MVPGANFKQIAINLHRIAAVLYTLCLGVVIARGPRSYNTNDDPGMQAIASGDFTGRPDARWVFSDPLTSWPITLLYRVVRLPWYALFQYGLHLVAGAAIVWVLFRRRDRIGPVVLASAILVMFVMQQRLVVLLSFTGTAFMAGFAGVALAFDTTDRRHRESWFSGIVAALLLISAASIRSDVVPSLLLVGGPLAFIQGRAKLPRLLAFGSVPLLATALNWLIIRIFTETPYHDYLRYNELRGSLHATPRLSALSLDTMAEIDWSSVDLYLFSRFIYDDDRLFGVESLEVIARASEGARGSLTSGLVLNDVVLAYPGMAVLIAISIVVTVSSRNWRVLCAQLAIFGLVTIAMTWLAISARLPERVSLPLWLGAAIAVVLSLGMGEPREHMFTRTWKHRVPAIRIETLSIVLLFAMQYQITWGGHYGPEATRAWSAATTARYQDQIEFLASRPPGTTVVASGDALKVEGMDPLSASTVWADSAYISLGWWVFSPMFENRKMQAPTSADLTSPRDEVLTMWFGTTSETTQYNQYLLRNYDSGSGDQGLVSLGCAPLQPHTCLYNFSP